MTILIIGGQAKVGLRVSRLLHAANYSGLVTSRSGSAPDSPFKAVPFDWTDPSTFENPFQEEAHIERVYLGAPPIANLLPLMQPFIELAVTKGVKRFVLMSAAQSEKGGYITGKVHAYLDSIGVEYVALRPTWFQENFEQRHLRSVRDMDSIFSVAGDGKMRSIACDDIAEVAFDALTSEKVSNSGPLILGPDAQSYDEIAEMLTDVLGRKITHKKLSPEALFKLYESVGFPYDYAHVLIGCEQDTANGVEEQWFSSKDTVVGKRHLKDYFMISKDLWIPKAREDISEGRTV